MPRSPGMRPLCHLSWAAPHPRPRPVAGAWKAGEGRGTGEGTGGGQGQHHTFPQVSVSGGRGTFRCGRGTSSQYRLAPSSQTLQPHRAPSTPRPALCLHLLSPLRHPQSEAIRHLRDPQPVEHPLRGLRCHPCSTAFSLDLGPGRNCDFRGLVCRAQGFRWQGLMGGKSQPQGGTLRTLWDI